METIIKNQYAQELEHIEKNGCLPEWNQQKSKMTSFYFNPRICSAWDSNGNAFMIAEDEGGYKVLPLKVVVETKWIKLFITDVKYSNWLVLIYDKVKKDWYSNQVEAKPFNFQTFYDVVATQQVDSFGWDFHYFDRYSSYYKFSKKIFSYMHYIEYFYECSDGQFIVKGLKVGTQDVKEYRFVKCPKENIICMQKEFPAGRKPIWKNVCHALNSDEAAKYISTEHWYDIETIFQDYSILS